MWKKIEVISVLLILIGAIILCYVHFEKAINQRPTTEQVIDSLSSKIDSIKTENITLIQRNDSIQVKIIEVEKNYEKIVDTILVNNVSDDYIFFANYIARYLDNNYSDTTKDR